LWSSFADLDDCSLGLSNSRSSCVVALALTCGFTVVLVLVEPPRQADLDNGTDAGDPGGGLLGSPGVNGRRDA
jgi:hypothetical protein